MVNKNGGPDLDSKAEEEEDGKNESHAQDGQETVEEIPRQEPATYEYIQVNKWCKKKCYLSEFLLTEVLMTAY